MYKGSLEVLGDVLYTVQQCSLLKDIGDLLWYYERPRILHGLLKDLCI